MLLKAKSGRWPFPYDAKSPSGHLRVRHRKAAAAQRSSSPLALRDYRIVCVQIDEPDAYYSA